MQAWPQMPEATEPSGEKGFTNPLAEQPDLVETAESLAPDPLEAKLAEVNQVVEAAKANVEHIRAEANPPPVEPAAPPLASHVIADIEELMRRDPKLEQPESLALAGRLLNDITTVKDRMSEEFEPHAKDDFGWDWDDNPEHRQQRQLHDETSRELGSLSWKLREQANRRISEEVDAQVEVVKSAYRELLNNIKSDGRLLHELRASWLREFVEPELQQYTQEDWRNFDAEKAAKCLALFQELIDTPVSEDPHAFILMDREDPERAAKFQELHELLPYSSSADHYRYTILEGSDAGIIDGLIMWMASRSIKQLSPNGYYSGLRGGSDAAHFMTGDLGTWPKTDLERFRLLKKLPLAQELFGPELDIKEAEINEQLLSGVLEDTQGGKIDVLVDFPEPEAIASLIVIALAENRGYSNIHANEVLHEWSKRPDWPELFQAAAAVHPEIADLGPALTHWQKFGSHSFNPELDEAAPAFGKKLLKGSNQKFERHALTMLGNEDLIQVLTERGSLSSELAEMARATLATAKQLRQLREDFNEHTLTFEVRRLLDDAASGRRISDEDVEYFKHRSHRWSKLAAEMDKHKDDEKVVQFLATFQWRDELFKLSDEHLSVLLSAHEKAPIILTNELALQAILLYPDYFRSEGGLEFLQTVFEFFGADANNVLTAFSEQLSNGTLDRTELLTVGKVFIETHTSLSPDRLEGRKQALQSFEAEKIRSLGLDDAETERLILDIAAYYKGAENLKLTLARENLTKLGEADVAEFFTFLRWLPESELNGSDDFNSLKSKYEHSLSAFTETFARLYHEIPDYLDDPANQAKLIQELRGVTDMMGLQTRSIRINGHEVGLPVEFIRSFGELRKQNAEIKLLPELAKFVADRLAHETTAYTVNDIIFSQISMSRDPYGRRAAYDTERVMEAISANIDASHETWSTAVEFQGERPESPLFIIANERTGPADLAAEFLPTDVAERLRVAQNVDYEAFFQWLRANLGTIDDLYQRRLNGESVDLKVFEPARQLLQLGEKLLIPIYRLKIPSSLNAATEEPDGINDVMTFFKLAALMGGRTVFMDESTRSAPRSIECLYNALKRREDDLGGVSLRLFGKIAGVTAQNGTVLEEVVREDAPIEVGFIDPWRSPEKPINDDSEGFVPEVRGTGIIQIIRPSLASVGPWGIGTIQDFWKRVVAYKAAQRLSSEAAEPETASAPEVSPLEDGGIG